MKKREERYSDPWDRDFYETGSTRPPKQRGGLIAFLLVLVLLLGGACSTLGIINVHLLRQLAAGGRSDSDTVDLFQEEQLPASVQADPDPDSVDRIAPLGIHGRTVSDFDRKYYELPQGVLVTAVTESRSAHRAGIRAGDVIFSLGGKTVTNREELNQALSGCVPGETVRVEFYRNRTGQNMSADITVSREEE